MDKLRVWTAVKTAYASIWLHRRRLAGLAVVPVLLAVAIELAIQPWIGGLDRIVFDEPDAQWLPGAVAAGQLREALLIAVWAGFELPCYRLFLLGTGAALPGHHWRAIYASLLTFSLMLVAIYNLPSIAFDYARIAGDVSDTASVDLILSVAYGAVTVRLAFVFPAICLGWRWDLRRRWAETRGNFWRLLLAFMLAYVPVFVLVVLFMALGLDVTRYELSGGAVSVVQAAVRAIVSLASLLPGIAVTVAAVAQLTGHSASGLTGRGPGMTEIAERFD